MQIVDCKTIRERVLDGVKEKLQVANDKVSLAIVTASDDEASRVYVRNKIKTCESLGIEVHHFDFEPDKFDQKDLELFVTNLNNVVNGIMVQLPLDKKYNAQDIIDCIDWDKDVDGLTTYQKGLLVSDSDKAIVPCTALGCKLIMEDVYKDLTGLNVCIVNRSDLIGKPLDALLRNSDCTVTVCHSRTNEWALKERMSNSDVVILGTGQVRTYDKWTFDQKDQLVIDCSICRDEDGKLCGEVVTESLMEVEDDTFYLAKSPGGVGSIVTALVCHNLMKCYELQK